MQVRIAFMASVIFTYPAIRKSASTRVFSSSVISRMADMGLNFRITPPDIKYEDGMLSVTKIDDCTICFRDDSNGKVRKYRKAFRTDKPAKYVFWAEYRGARSPEVAHPDHFKTIQPKVKLTSSIPENPEQGYDKVSEILKLVYLWKYQASKVIFHGKLILLYENLLECCNIVLFIEHQHRFLIIHRVHCTLNQLKTCTAVS